MLKAFFFENALETLSVFLVHAKYVTLENILFLFKEKILKCEKKMGKPLWFILSTKTNVTWGWSRQEHK